MSSFSEQDLDKLISLCRISCTEEEKRGIRGDLSKVLSYITLLSEVNTEGVSPCNHVVETMHTVWREDQVEETFDREIFLENAPAHVGGMIRIPPDEMPV
jgi:aspartyl-tRNA(Asn)/glutamyl-tRNA(Gln) amidotransferase subunit C